MNPYLVERLQPFGTTIFAEMSALAVETGAINLGQGFPGHRRSRRGQAGRHRRDPRRATTSTRPASVFPELRVAIRAHQQRFYALDYDADAEILVTAGATEAIAAALIALCGPGDEVVTFEPYYDSYAACIAMAGAHAARRHVARPRLQLRSRRAARRDHAAHRSSSCSTRRTTRQARCSPAAELDGRRRDRAGARPARRHRRGLRASRLRGRTRAAGHAAGDARPHGHDRFGRQDVFVHRLEGRLGVRDLPSSWWPSRPRSSSSPT